MEKNAEDLRYRNEHTLTHFPLPCLKSASGRIDCVHQRFGSSSSQQAASSGKGSISHGHEMSMMYLCVLRLCAGNKQCAG